MTLKEAQYERKGHVIKNLSTRESTSYTRKHEGGDVPAINAAKKASRGLQPVLGDGTVRVVK